MRVTGVHERAVPVSRYADPTLPSGGLDTSIVAITTDAVRDGRRVVGFGFSSIGRFAQGGLIRERFAPRLMVAAPDCLAGEMGECDPCRAWNVMMTGEKRGGHGERCVAVGTLDMALWDIAAKLAGLPLHRLLSRLVGRASSPDVAVYAAGGYVYPVDDLVRLQDEMARFRDGGHIRAKIKVAALPLCDDLRRVETASRVFGSGRLAVDAMNAYAPGPCFEAARSLEPFSPMWFEDICDPLDFETQRQVAEAYGGSLAAGEALFSEAEAALLDRHGGLRRDRDVLVFDPVHCYGLPGYMRILFRLEGSGWPRSAFWPHGGHLFALHVVAGLGLGGAEMNPGAFLPFSRLPPGLTVCAGRMGVPDVPGIGFEGVPGLCDLFKGLLE